MRKSNCECSMAIAVLVDGCRYCQPQEYIDRLEEWLDEERAQVANLEKIAKRLIFDFEHYENGEPHVDDIHYIVADARQLIEKAGSDNNP